MFSIEIIKAMNDKAHKEWLEKRQGQKARLNRLILSLVVITAQAFTDGQKNLGFSCEKFESKIIKALKEFKRD